MITRCDSIDLLILTLILVGADAAGMADFQYEADLEDPIVQVASKIRAMDGKLGHRRCAREDVSE